MPELVSRANDNPEFARVIEVRQLRDLARFDFDISPQPAEAAALASLLGAQAVRKLRFAGHLVPVAKDGWALEAALGATVVQTCVVTLEPVTTRIDETVRRAFIPGLKGGAEIEVSPEEDDEIEPLRDRIDLGRVAIEALALALPAYPRKEGANLGGGDEDGDMDRPKPFAALAALREKLGPGEA